MNRRQSLRVLATRGGVICKVSLSACETLRPFPAFQSDDGQSIGLVMSTVKERFECVREPLDTWMIWNHERQQIMSLSGKPLIGLHAEEAASLCDFLNDLADGVTFADARKPARRAGPASEIR